MKILLARNFVDTAFVATSFELGGKENLNQFYSLLCGDIVGWQADNIGIIVLTSEASEWFVPAECSAYALVVVASHSDAVTSRADSDAHVVGAVFYGSCHRVGEVRIVAAISRRTTIVGDLNALLGEPSDNSLFECEACVVRGDAEFEIFHVSDEL